MGGNKNAKIIGGRKKLRKLQVLFPSLRERQFEVHYGMLRTLRKSQQQKDEARFVRLLGKRGHKKRRKKTCG